MTSIRGTRPKFHCGAVVAVVGLISLCFPLVQAQEDPPAPTSPPPLAVAPTHTNVYKSEFDRAIQIDRWSPLKTGKAPENLRSFLGEYSFQTPLFFKLDDLPEHRFIRLRADLLILKSWDGLNENLRPDTWGILEEGGPLLMLTSFCNPHVKIGADGTEERLARQQCYPDEYPFARHPAATGSTGEGKQLGFKFRKDLETTDTIYKIDLIFPHTTKELALRFFARLTHHKDDESWALDNVIIDTIDGETALDEKQLEARWKKLSGKDPVAANASLWEFVAAGEAGREFVWKRWKEHLAKGKNAAGPATVALRAKVEKLLEGLADDSFINRQTAQKELGVLGVEVLGILTEHAAKTKDPQVRRSLTTVIAKLRRGNEAKLVRIHQNSVRSRVNHIMRVFETRSNDYAISSSPVNKPKHGFDCLGAPADGYVPTASHHAGVPRYTWFPKRGTSEWLQYDFPKPKTISKAEVYWYTAEKQGQISLPESWEVQYQDAAGNWVPVDERNGYAVDADKLNRVEFKPVNTKAVRLVAKLRENRSAGLHEFRVSHPDPK